MPKSQPRSRRTRRSSASGRGAIRERVDRALEVGARTRKLFILQVAVEVGGKAELESMQEQISRVLCPNEPSSCQKCPRRWFVVTHPADAKERRAWDPLLNE